MILAGWRDHLGHIQQDLYRAHHNQHIWTDFRDAVIKNDPTADGTFLASYSSVYAHSQGVVIRRQIDPDRRTHSLVNLLGAITRNPKVMSRTRFLEDRAGGREPDRLDGWFHQRDTEAWARFAREDDPEHLNVEIPLNDINTLTTELSDIKEWVDEQVAHLDRRRFMTIANSGVPSFGRLREALALLARTAQGYESLLTNGATGDWTPTVQGDWRQPLRRPVFPAAWHPWEDASPEDFT